MDSFVSKKRRRLSAEHEEKPNRSASAQNNDEDSTDVKLAILSSLHPNHHTKTCWKFFLAAMGRSIML